MGKIRTAFKYLRVAVRDIGAASLDALPLPYVPPESARGVVFSVYMPNISRRVVMAQRKMLLRYVPTDIAIIQIRTRSTHPQALTQFVRSTRYKTVAILDIDCVPIHHGAMETLFDTAESGVLIGASARSNHIQNDEHVYAGPYCMAFSMDTYAKLGRPNFEATERGDVAEELTYLAEQRGIPVKFLWAQSSEDELIWDLKNGRRYGHGTTYDGGFWHAFSIRRIPNQDSFVARMEQFLHDGQT